MLSIVALQKCTIVYTKEKRLFPQLNSGWVGHHYVGDNYLAMINCRVCPTDCRYVVSHFLNEP
jgi:hypothetical protein